MNRPPNELVREPLDMPKVMCGLEEAVIRLGQSIDRNATTCELECLYFDLSNLAELTRAVIVAEYAQRSHK